MYAKKAVQKYNKKYAKLMEIVQVIFCQHNLNTAGVPDNYIEI